MSDWQLNRAGSQETQEQWWSATGFFGCPKDFYRVSSTEQQEENDCDGVQGY